MQQDDNPRTRSPQHVKPIGFGKRGGGRKADSATDSVDQKAEGQPQADGAAEKASEAEDEHGPGNKHELSYCPPGF